MSGTRELPYKTSRKAAGYTQMEAIEHLGVADTTLSSYENGARVPDDIVDKMCELYDDPMLAYWHMRQTTLLGSKYLPPLTDIDSMGEMAFQSIVAGSKIDPVVESLTYIASDGAVSSSEAAAWRRNIEEIKDITSRLLSVLIYSWKVSVEKEKAPAAAVPL